MRSQQYQRNGCMAFDDGNKPVPGSPPSTSVRQDRGKSGAACEGRHVPYLFSRLQRQRFPAVVFVALKGLGEADDPHYNPLLQTAEELARPELPEWQCRASCSSRSSTTSSDSRVRCRWCSETEYRNRRRTSRPLSRRPFAAAPRDASPPSRSTLARENGRTGLQAQAFSSERPLGLEIGRRLRYKMAAWGAANRESPVGAVLDELWYL